MKLASQLLFFTLVCMLCGCGDLFDTESGSAVQTDASGNSNLTYLDIEDPKMGMVMLSIPFPAGWQVDTNPNDQLIYTGPNDTLVYQTSSGKYFHSNDQFRRQSAQIGGVKLSPVIPLEQFLKQYFVPNMAQHGYQLINSYSMPKVIDFWDLYAAGMPQGLSRKQYNAIGAEWENSDGSKAFTILIQHQLQQPGQTLWEVTAGELYTSDSEYNTAKNDYVHAVLNTQVNAQWQIKKNNQLMAQIRQTNREGNQRLKQSQIAHMGRMNSILARGTTSSSVAKINSDILDINHSGYLKRSSMVSAGQANSVNMIGEQSVIRNNNTGEYYQVDSGAENYWVNNEGKYFSTDNSNYDPRTDNRINNQQWLRFDVVK